jgi:L-2,4-diaminobutyric acid acetyltransferase
VQSPNAAPASTTLRSPTADDGPALWRLARDSGGLDLNSPYAYVLAGHHFASTSVVADGPVGPAGFVYAYLPPTEPDSVFVWQVTVSPTHRGEGLARRMLHEVVGRAVDQDVRRMTATVTPSNDASRRLFTSVAHDLGATIDERPCFPARLLSPQGDTDHEPEHLLVIDPLTTTRSTPEGTP